MSLLPVSCFFRYQKIDGEKMSITFEQFNIYKYLPTEFRSLATALIADDRIGRKVFRLTRKHLNLYTYCIISTIKWYIFDQVTIKVSITMVLF